MSLVNSDADKNIKFIALDSLRKKKRTSSLLKSSYCFFRGAESDSSELPVTSTL